MHISCYSSHSALIWFSVYCRIAVLPPLLWSNSYFGCSERLTVHAMTFRYKKYSFKQDLIQRNLSRPTQFNLVHIYLQSLCSVNDIICFRAFIGNRSCCMLCGSALRESRWHEWNIFSRKWEKEKENACVYLLEFLPLRKMLKTFNLVKPLN